MNYFEPFNGEVMSVSEVTDMIREMVARASYPGIEGQETETAKYIQQVFEKEGIPAEVELVADGRSNVTARLKGAGGGRKLLLTGHMDTVPPYDMENSLEMVERDGNLYGRGTVDMKGQLACMMAAIISVKRAGMPFSGEVVFGGVIDEEEGSLGTIHLIEREADFDGVVVGEPTSMNICIAHRGLEWIEIHVKGKTVHGGSQDKGKSAIQMACRLIDSIDERLNARIAEQEHSLIGRGSYNIGTIVGGTQPSTVPGDCIITLDRRWLPGEKYEVIMGQLEELLEEYRSSHPDYQFAMKVMDPSRMPEGYVHEAMETDRNHDLVTLAEAISEQVVGKKAELTFFPAWSDGGLLNGKAGIPTIIYAPGDLESAHSAEEHIEVAQLIPAVKAYVNLILNFCR